MNEDRVRLTCSLHAEAFIVSHDRASTVSLLQALRPHHRTILVQELIRVAIHSNDTSDAFAVGSLLSSRIVDGLCNEGDSLHGGLKEQLAWLEDVVLDVPHAPRLLAYILQGIGFSLKLVEQMVIGSLPSGHHLVGALLTEMKNLQDYSDSTTDGQDSVDEGYRRNRFERTPSQNCSYARSS